MGMWDWITSALPGMGGGSSPGAAGGYSNLTPDQQQMVTQQGWYPRPDMVMPTGSTLQQPTGYSGLTPAQASTVNSLGYYTPGQDGGQSTSMWSDLAKKISSPAGESGIKDLQGALGGQQQRPNTAPPGLLSRPATPMNPYHNLYTPTVLDPKQALLRYQRGY